MSQKIQPVRGTRDLLGDEYQRHDKVITVAQTIAQRFGYEPIATPIFEYTPVFKRTLGETSDVIGKEMYCFPDRGGEEITLRPEGTAGVIRAVISNGLTQSLPLKLAYHGPMFRYERPQLGRYRQLHQFGVECIGIAHPLVDVETISLAVDVLRTLEIADKVQLEINTIGDIASRQAYRQALINYFTPFIAQLSEDSQQRLHRNPLRILDSKDEGDRKLIANAPRFEDYLNLESQQFFFQVCQGLDQLGISYIINRRLVRGLDYYNHTAFEFVTTELGAQGTVLAGGRYDGLMAQMGGPETPGVGWALGIDRIALLLPENEAKNQPVAVIPVGDEKLEKAAFVLAMNLRQQGVCIDFIYNGNMGKRMKRANKVNAAVALLLGETEQAQGEVTVKDLGTGEQKTLALSDIYTYLKSNFPKTIIA